MRDPDRINTILNELETYWKDRPDLRLGQIVSNANADKRPHDPNDPFYMEDYTFLSYIKRKNRGDDQ